jgi:hypothetical protein
MPKTIVLKHDISANWAKATNFVPKQGEIIIYDDMDPPFKIGDGVRNVNDLPFVNDLIWNTFPSIEKGEEINE